MATITTNSGRGLYDGGQPLPGKVIGNDPGELIYAGVVNGALPFGRLVAPFVLQTDGKTKLFTPVDEVDTKSDGISVYSFDAIASQSSLEYSDEEAAAVINKGFVVMETDSDLALDNSALTIVNGEGSGQAADVGKLSQTTGVGWSTTTNLRLVEKISATLALVQITGEVTLVAGV